MYAFVYIYAYMHIQYIYYIYTHRDMCVGSVSSCLLAFYQNATLWNREKNASVGTERGKKRKNCNGAHKAVWQYKYTSLGD